MTGFVERDLQLIRYLLIGASDEQIARRLKLPSKSAVQARIIRICKRLGLKGPFTRLKLGTYYTIYELERLHEEAKQAYELVTSRLQAKNQHQLLAVMVCLALNYQEVTHDSCAKELGVSPATIRGRQYRAAHTLGVINNDVTLVRLYLLAQFHLVTSIRISKTAGPEQGG